MQHSYTYRHATNRVQDTLHRHIFTSEVYSDNPRFNLTGVYQYNNYVFIGYGRLIVIYKKINNSTYQIYPKIYFFKNYRKGFYFNNKKEKELAKLLIAETNLKSVTQDTYDQIEEMTQRNNFGDGYTVKIIQNAQTN
ncbi:UNVERIFIED_CONTAM: hypothetical protein O8I53_06365 [Campylobacter lari]